jgi:hypothetical protein
MHTKGGRDTPAVVVALLVLLMVGAAKQSLGAAAAPLPQVNLNKPVPTSVFYGPTREDVLKVYPEKFIVNWDSPPTTDAASWEYQWCGTAATTCEVKEMVECSCMDTKNSFSFPLFVTLPMQDLNTPVHASSPDGIPTRREVENFYYLMGFSVDWTEGHDGTVAAGTVYDACGGPVPTTCILEDAGLDCVCHDLTSVFLGYETLQSPNDSSTIPASA